MFKIITISKIFPFALYFPVQLPFPLYLERETLTLYLSLIFLSLVLPHITPFEFESEANTGDSVQLNCHVSKGDTPLNISWLLNGKEIKNVFGITTTSFGTRTNLLTINSVQAEHSGLYTCRASNRGGEAAHTAELLINGT